MVEITSWGRLGTWEHRVVPLTDRDNIFEVVQGDQPGIAFGMGRSYGDVCLNPNGTLWDTKSLDRLIHFNPETGILRCEAGVLLRDIQRLFIPRGWMLPVTPGTQLITVGGAIAHDVHGKNHHVLGSFGDHISQIKLLRTDGSLIQCGPQELPDWFAATVGGFGLTGIIVEASIQLRQVTGPWLNTETVAFSSLDEFYQLSAASDCEYNASWVDCLSGAKTRGLLVRGNHTNANSEPHPRASQKTMPFVPPISLVNRLSLRLFNSVYYHFNKRKKNKTLTHYERFLYPLDHIHNWNRMYGPKGFFQYQSVVPEDVGRDATAAMLKAIARSGEGSFLTVLKTFGHRDPIGMMSFARPGVTLALDFPNKGKRTAKLFERLDAIVREANGRLYLAKDARMPRDLFENGYPNLPAFLCYRDPGISSALSRRLIGS